MHQPQPGPTQPPNLHPRSAESSGGCSSKHQRCPPALAVPPSSGSPFAQEAAAGEAAAGGILVQFRLCRGRSCRSHQQPQCHCPRVRHQLPCARGCKWPLAAAERSRAVVPARARCGAACGSTVGLKLLIRWGALRQATPPNWPYQPPWLCPVRPQPRSRSGPPRFMADLCSFCVSFSLCAAGAVAGGREGRGGSLLIQASPRGSRCEGLPVAPLLSPVWSWSVPSLLFPLPPSGEGSVPRPFCCGSASPPQPAGRPLSPLPLPFPPQTTTAGTTATRRAAATPAPATSSSATAGAASPCTGPATGTTTAGTTATRPTPTAPTRVRLGWPCAAPRCPHGGPRSRGRRGG